MPDQVPYHYAVGRRKTAVATVRLVPGSGLIVVNGRPADQYFGRATLEYVVNQPFREANLAASYNAIIKCVGGGLSGQAGAVRHAIARALVKSDEGLRPVMRRGGFLTRDPRAKERKKYGLKRARKAPQYTKR
ncbi:MAG: 30S ribosomal protein S9 [Chloroflexota bacterium]|nr:30S ribosomal protein S9 [Chloroflexota bacterium]